MLQSTNPLTTNRVTTQAEWRPALVLEEQGSIRETVNGVIGLLRRQFVVIAFFTLLATSLGVIYIFTKPVTYTAETTLIIDPRRVQLFQGAAFAEGQVDSPPALESQIELAKSEVVALSVIRDLRLAEDPEFVRSKDGSKGVLGIVSHFSSSTKPSDTRSEIEATRVALAVLSKNLTVNRVGSSHILSITYRSLKPDRAMQIVNAIAEAYIAEQVKGRYQSTRRATEWLQGKIEELNQKRALADRAVLDFKQEHNMIAADGKLLNEQQVMELNSQLAIARKQTSEAKARLNRIDDVIRDGAVETTASATDVADYRSNPVITQLRTRYLEFVDREARYSRKYGTDHMSVVNLRDQISELRRSISEELKKIQESHLSNYEIAKQQEQDLEKRLAEAVSQSRTVNKAQVALRELETSAQSLRTMHDLFLQRYTESLQQQSFPISEARIFSPASLADKSNHKTALILAMAAAGGFAFGVAVGWFRELMNCSLHTREQVESALQTACISIVPLVASHKDSKLSRSAKPMLSSDQDLGDGFNGQRFIPHNPDVFWTVLNSPLSRFAEAIRSIKLAIDQNSGAASSGRNAVSKDGKPLYGAAKASSIAKREREACTIIGFTSSLPNEGKSTIALSVALLMAHAGARVILVDCDLRHPALSQSLAPNAEHGILDVIAGRMPLDDVVWTDRSTNLRFVPATLKTHFIHSSDVLATDAIKELFENLRSMYDYVLVDLSPLMPVVDARATSMFVDSYVCVVEWGRTKIDAVKYAFKDAENLSENLLGVVLNKADIDRLSRHYPIGENHYRNKHYGQYGLTE